MEKQSIYSEDFSKNLSNENIKKKLSATLENKNLVLKGFENKLNIFSDFLWKENLENLKILEKVSKNSWDKNLSQDWDSFEKSIFEIKKLFEAKKIDWNKISSLWREILEKLEMISLHIKGSNYETLAWELLWKLREKFEKYFFENLWKPQVRLAK